MANQEEDRRRYPRSLQGLLQMAVNTSDDAESSTDSSTFASSVFQEMTEERRQWLQEALSSIAEDTDVKRMMTYLQILEKPQNDTDDDDDLTEKEDAFEGLSMIVDNLDNANDFHKIGGYHVMTKCLSSEHSSLRLRAADILAVCVQNNPYCQKAAMEMNILPTLSTLLETDQSEQVKIKALYAISCLTRDFPSAEEAFLKGDGFSILIRAMQGENEKLITKSAFMLRNMLVTNPLHKETLFKMGFIEQLVGLLRSPQNSSHEHIVSLLVTFVTDYPQGISECHRPEFDLEKILKSIITSSMEDDPDLHEEMILNCKELLNICFNKQTQPNAGNNSR
ncbi:Hsp70-binding protein 1 [Desmophyllum pertusum]|uniref:Hsp70-binding protein 1 n=1 Tax=Desmophyllum pertusum TaxID=174260 RepID=A0A9W9YPL7_9CNID|nr:Hsp70-binding protein 1 [Desmophyllum pertusum]